MSPAQGPAPPVFTAQAPPPPPMFTPAGAQGQKPKQRPTTPTFLGAGSLPQFQQGQQKTLLGQ